MRASNQFRKPSSVVCLSFDRGGFEFLKGAAELVGAGGVLYATADAVEPFDDIIDVLAAHQLADTLQVAVAATKEEYLLDDVVLVGCHVNQFRACAFSLVLYMFSFHIFFSWFCLRI